ncbi:hypothetical protein EV128_108220 [Rhizobium azibense]|nr:hypothetical protein EV128_108220 [Rhizobium azibense]
MTELENQPLAAEPSILKTRLSHTARDIAEFSLLAVKDVLSCVILLLAIKGVEVANHWIFGPQGLVFFKGTGAFAIHVETLIGVGHFCTWVLFLIVSVYDYYKVFFK